MRETREGAGGGTLVRVTWEHTHRELLPTLLLLHHLAARGGSTQLEHVKSIGPGGGGREVLLLPFLYDERDRDLWLSEGHTGKCLVNLCYEQMHPANARAYMMPSDDFAQQQVTFCTWGPRYRELLIEHGVPADHVHVVGHPRFDIYHYPDLLLGRSELAERYSLDADKRWVLVPYNFNLAYISERLRQTLNQRGYLITQEMIDSVAKARDAFTAMVKALVERFPEIEFILRVHPAGYESESLYRGGADAWPNLHLISEFDIANWISEASLTIVWNSTSAMEAMAAGRRVVSYEPYPFSEVFDYDVNRILTNLQTLDELIDVLADEPELDYDWTRFERWYAHRDGRCTDRLAEVIDVVDSDYERRQCRANDRELAILKTKWTKRIKRWAGKLDTHPAPSNLALERAVAGPSFRPLGDFVR